MVEYSEAIITNELGAKCVKLKYCWEKKQVAKWYVWYDIICVKVEA